MDLQDEFDEQSLIDCIVTQNPELLVSLDDFKLIRLYKYRNKFGAIIQTTVETLQNILQAEKLKIMWGMARVFEHLRVFRCFKCQGFNHTAKECTVIAICNRCGHEKKDKHEDTCHLNIKSCTNCLAANKKYNLKLDIYHNPTDTRCTVFQREAAKFKNRFYWDEEIEDKQTASTDANAIPMVVSQNKKNK